MNISAEIQQPADVQCQATAAQKAVLPEILLPTISVVCHLSSVAGDARYDFINQTRATPHHRRVRFNTKLIQHVWHHRIMRLIHLIMSLDSKNTPSYIYYRVGGQQGEETAVPANKRTVLSPVEIKTRCRPDIVLHCWVL